MRDAIEFGHEAADSRHYGLLLRGWQQVSARLHMSLLELPQIRAAPGLISRLRMLGGFDQ